MDSKRVYAVKQAVSEKEVARMTGDELLNKGFRVELKNKYDGEIHELDEGI